MNIEIRVLLKSIFILAFFAPLAVQAESPAITEILAIARAKTNPDPRLPSSNASYVFLRVPTNYVGSCVQNKLGQIQTVMFLFSRVNGGSLGRQDVKVLPDGKIQSLDGRPLISEIVKDSFNVQLMRLYDCQVPVLNEEQVQQIEKVTGIVGFSPVPNYYFPYVPEGPFELSQSDLFLSQRYNKISVGNFQFSWGQYTPGFAINSIINNPGSYGLHAVYHTVNGSCATGSLSGFEEARENLLTHCSEKQIYAEADKFSKGVGMTVLMAIPTISR